MSHTSVSKILKEAGVERRKRRKVPKSDENQQKKHSNCLNIKVIQSHPMVSRLQWMTRHTLPPMALILIKMTFFYCHFCLPVPQSLKTKPTPKFADSLGLDRYES